MLSLPPLDGTASLDGYDLLYRTTGESPRFSADEAQKVLFDSCNCTCTPYALKAVDAAMGASSAHRDQPSPSKETSQS